MNTISLGGIEPHRVLTNLGPRIPTPPKLQEII
jgi:hypothetical protein